MKLFICRFYYMYSHILLNSLISDILQLNKCIVHCIDYILYL